MKFTVKSVALLLTLILSQSLEVFALGSGAIGNETGVATKATAHGYAFSGVADDPSAIHYNPAGLVQSKGFQTMLGASIVSPKMEHTSSPAGVNDEMASNTPPIPYFYTSLSKQDSRWAFGLGVNAPFGLITEWKEDSVFKYYATTTKLLMYNVAPVIAYSVNDKLSIGGGLNYFNVYDTELNARVFNLDSGLIPGSPTGDGRSKITGDGTAWGYNLSMHMKANARHSFGLTYRSQVNVPIEGETELTELQDATAFAFGGTSFKTDTRTEFKFPQSVLLGYGFRPNEKWTIFADYEWANWNVVEETHFDYASNPSGLLPTSIRRNWKNSNNIGIGAELKASDRVDYRFGLLAYERVIPSGTLEATLPDAGRIGPTFGTGIKFGNSRLDLGYNLIIFNKRDVNNGQETALYSQDGEFKTTVHVFSVGLMTKWGGQGS